MLLISQQHLYIQWIIWLLGITTYQSHILLIMTKVHCLRSSFLLYIMHTGHLIWEGHPSRRFLNVMSDGHLKVVSLYICFLVLGWWWHCLKLFSVALLALPGSPDPPASTTFNHRYSSIQWLYTLTNLPLETQHQQAQSFYCIVLTCTGVPSRSLVSCRPKLACSQQDACTGHKHRPTWCNAIIAPTCTDQQTGQRSPAKWTAMFIIGMGLGE